ncbi:hypothetical protein ZIOFF_002131 [Zingiber officinale]|uniref:RRM domain-containing protein n=1 Tax=Zingiber officinale TaxID=94328 RepID=A0A8J5IPP7_ZINOF|nr:hypothetical protein ZIOFF_002131 [Zingiber officinale]
MDRDTRQSNWVRFVIFTSSEQASAAISGMDGKDIHSRMIRVNYATDRTGGFRGGSSGYRGSYGSGGYGGRGGASGGGYGDYGSDLIAVVAFDANPIVVATSCTNSIIAATTGANLASTTTSDHCH